MSREDALRLLDFGKRIKRDFLIEQGVRQLVRDPRFADEPIPLDGQCVIYAVRWRLQT